MGKLTSSYLKIITLFLFLLIVVLLIELNLPDKRLHIVMCDVGQGDSVLIYQSFLQVVVDGGRGKELLSCLAKHVPFWDRTIELVVLTHPQDDHYGGLVELSQRYQIRYFIANGVGADATNFETLRRAISKQQSSVILPRTGLKYLFGQLTISLLWPNKVVGNQRYWEKADFQITSQIASDGVKKDLSFDNNKILNLNDISIVTLISYKNFDFLLTGDMGAPQEQALLASHLLTDVDVLKVAHHGSKYSSTKEFLQVVKPEVSLIGVGKNNRFGHPTEETLTRLNQIGSKIYRTDLQGTIEIVSDGQSYWVK